MVAATAWYTRLRSRQRYANSGISSGLPYMQNGSKGIYIQKYFGGSIKECDLMEVKITMISRRLGKTGKRKGNDSILKSN
jgi:hypothetical protein